MSTLARKIQKPPLHMGKSQALKKITRSTQNAMNSTIISLLCEKGAKELSIAEIRKRLSTLKVPLSHEIIQERNTV